jgi:hypothetical protein
VSRLDPGADGPARVEIRTTTGPWDVFLQTGADALLEQLRARIRAKEARQAHEHNLDEAVVGAALQEKNAQADFARAWQAEEHAAGVRLWEQVSLDAERMRQEASPFKLPPEDVCAIAAAATRGGELPALILAPFVDRTGGPAGVNVARQLWWRAQERADWTHGLAGLSGHLRAVSDLDLDLALIRNVLGVLPFVLVHGDVEVDRIQVRIVGSGVLPPPRPGHSAPDAAAVGPTVSICGTLPWPDVPGGYRVEVDMIDTVLACAGALGEVFHLVRSRRLPHLHERVPDWLRPGITSMIIGGYGVAIEKADTDPDAGVIRGLQDLVRSLPDDGPHGRRQTAAKLLEGVMRRLVLREVDL